MTARVLKGPCLSCGFNPLPDAEVADDPGQQETQGQVPVERCRGHFIRQPQHAIAVAREGDS